MARDHATSSGVVAMNPPAISLHALVLSGRIELALSGQIVRLSQPDPVLGERSFGGAG